MNLKELFEKGENGVLTYDQLMQLSKDNKVKLVDLSEGGYVDRKKYEDELSSRDNQISTLNNTISQRDLDLQDLKSKLEGEGTNAQKLTQLSSDLDNLRIKYDEDVKKYQAQLESQKYEFAVKEFANSKKFTSNAAKRDFINSMIGKGLKMENGTILGAEDFINVYTTDNADAFVVETKEEPKPTFVKPTQDGNVNTEQTSGFNFNFHSVR